MSRTIRNKPITCFRKIKTQAERRKVLDSEDQGIPVRPKRNLRRLPTQWDDRPIAAFKEIFEKKLDSPGMF